MTVYKMFFSLSMLLLSSCASMLGGIIPTDGNEIEQATPEDQKAEKELASGEIKTKKVVDTPISVVTNTAVSSLELKQARLWARVDELEDLIRKQKGKIKMLEKGLLLGIVPNDIEQTEPISMKKEVKITQRVVSKNQSNQPEKETEIDNIDGNGDKKEFLARMAKARDQFRSGRYGKAYLEFSKIDKEFSKNVATGEQKYWLGRCWYKLKEFQSARQHLQSFVGQYPTSPWTSSAKFYLAKVEMDLGLKEAAIRRFQQIIRENPYEGTAEAAKQILGTIHKAL